MQSAARPIESSQLKSSHDEFKRRPIQLNLSPIGVRNQRKFAQNPSPIRIRIPICTSVSIFSITFGLDVQLRWFKLSWKFNLKGYNFVVTLIGPKSSVKWSLKIWDFLQMRIQLVIGFLDLFKGSLGQNSGRLVLGLRAECIENCGYLFHDS